MRFKKKKVKKYRGSKTHGGGAMKKRRGAGNRGGRGRAGSGKRGDAKKPSYWKKKSGKKGFTSGNRKKVKALNLEVIHKKLNPWLKEGFVIKKPAGYELELKKLGYDKLLGAGSVKEKLIIITNFASKGAVEKIKKAGGEVKILQKKVVKQKKVVEKKKEVEEEKEEKEVKEEVKEEKKEKTKEVKEETSKQRLAVPEIQKSAKLDFASSTNQDLLKPKISESKTKNFGKQSFSEKRKEIKSQAGA